MPSSGPCVWSTIHWASLKATTSYYVRITVVILAVAANLSGFLTIGYLMGFTLSRSAYLSFNGIFCNSNNHNPLLGAAPMECYWYLKDPYKTGIQLHLYTILPAAFLVCFQFVPAIRHNVILFHRMNGYLVIVLSLTSAAGVLMITKHAFGGDFATQTYVGVLIIITALGYLVAWINIKRLQIDQHRAWMMRTWAYVSILPPKYVRRLC